MGYAELIEKLQTLPSEKQAEVFGFVEFLSDRFGAKQPATRGEWTDAKFAEFAKRLVLRGSARAGGAKIGMRREY